MLNFFQAMNKGTKVLAQKLGVNQGGIIFPDCLALLYDVAAVSIQRADGYIQLPCSLYAVQAANQYPQYFLLALRQCLPNPLTLCAFSGTLPAKLTFPLLLWRTIQQWTQARKIGRPGHKGNRDQRDTTCWGNVHHLAIFRLFRQLGGCINMPKPVHWAQKAHCRFQRNQSNNSPSTTQAQMNMLFLFLQIPQQLLEYIVDDFYLTWGHRFSLIRVIP